MAAKQGTKQKHEVYQCWVCSNNVTDDGTSSISCGDCSEWAHGRCVNYTDEFIGNIHKAERIRFIARCDSCNSEYEKQKEMVKKEITAMKHELETQKDVLRKLTGNIIWKER